MRILLFSILLLTGCQYNALKGGLDPFTSTNDPEQQLLQVARSIERSMADLAEASQQKPSPGLKTERLMTPEAGLGRIADIEWSGPIEPFLRKIADIGGYHFKVFGPPPPVPVLISINKKQVALADALKDAGLQTGKRAYVMVFPDSRIIELRYEVL